MKVISYFLSSNEYFKFLKPYKGKENKIKLKRKLRKMKIIKNIVIVSLITLNMKTVASSSFCTDPDDYECKHLGITKCVPKFNRSTTPKPLPIEKPPCAVPCLHTDSWCEERGACIGQDELCDCGPDKIYCTSADAYSCESRKGILQSHIFNICRNGACRKNCLVAEEEVAENMKTVASSSFCTDPDDYECKHLGITKCVPKFNRSTTLKPLPIKEPPCAVPCLNTDSWCEERGACIDQDDLCDCGPHKIYCTSADAYSCESRKGILQSHTFNICLDGACRKNCSVAEEEGMEVAEEEGLEECGEGQFRCGSMCLDNVEVVQFRTCNQQCISVHKTCFALQEEVAVGIIDKEIGLSWAWICFICAVFVGFVIFIIIHRKEGYIIPSHSMTMPSSLS